jgi:phage tail-like protein
MATIRNTPYGAFNYLVALGDQQGSGEAGIYIGGFSDVAGLGVEVSYSEYRNGNETFNTVRKVPNTHKVDDITLKRGVIGSIDLFQWVQQVARDGLVKPREVKITLLDEARSAVATWTLHNAQPKKWVGPTLAAKGGGEVAVEELHLVCEGVDYE